MTSLQEPEHDERVHDLAGGRARSARRRTRRACATMCAEFKRRHDVVLRRRARLPGFDCVPADGTFYLFPNVEAAMRAKSAATDVELCERLLDDAGVALVPGTAFGAPGHVRLSFAASMSTLEAALARLDEFLARADRIDFVRSIANSLRAKVIHDRVALTCREPSSRMPPPSTGTVPR